MTSRLFQRPFLLALLAMICALSSAEAQECPPILHSTCSLPPEIVSSSLLKPKYAAEVNVRLVFAGDLMQHMPQVHAAKRQEGYDYAPVFEHIRPRFLAADLAVVNLETTLTTTPPYTGYPRFRSPTALADALADIGVDLAVMANNHCLDGGLRGLKTTISELSRCAIKRTGVFVDSLDRSSNHPFRTTIKGIRFAVLNYSYGTNGIVAPAGVLVNSIDTLQIGSDLLKTRTDSTDCVVVCIHWGEEYQPFVNREQRRLADFMRRHGADMIIGSHPHVGQPWQADSTHVLLYSLGNFVSNQRRYRTDGGLMAQIDVTRRKDGRLVYKLDVIPIWVDLPTYRILPAERADTMQLPVAYRRFRRWVDSLQIQSYK